MNTILLTDIVQKLLVKNILNIPHSTVGPTHVSRIELWPSIVVDSFRKIACTTVIIISLSRARL